MATNKIRSSTQLYIDANLNVNSKKLESVSTGTADTDGVNVGQMNAAIGNARVYRATPSGTVNGSNRVFTIPALVLAGTEEVFKNGLLQNAGSGNDYTIVYAEETTITFESAPTNTPFEDIILVNYS